jgi:hypothetical protein
MCVKWTPDELARLKGLRDKAEPGSWDIRLGNSDSISSYATALVKADPLSEIERLQRIIAGMREWLDYRSEVVDGEREDGRSVPNLAMNGLRELERLEIKR